MVQLAKASGGRVVIVGTRDYRLELAKGMGAEHAFNIADSSSPYYTADLATAIRNVNAGELAERAIVATASEDATQGRWTSPATAPRSSTWASRARTTMRQAADALQPRDGQDDPLLVALSQPVAKHDPACCARGSSTPRRSSPTSIELDRIDEGIRQVVARDDGVIKIIVKP